jgi:TRAP-type mannitol/chloroaromatic compound transport system permease small subunit
MVVVRETFHGDLLEIDQLVREMAAETGGRVAWNLLSAVVIAAFLGLGYIAFDSATRGQFTWQLRLFAVIAFASLWFAASALNRYW